MKTKRLPATVEGLIEGIHRGIRAAAMAPNGTANITDHLTGPQLRLLARLAQKGGETPRQFLAGIVSRVTRGPRRKLANAGGVA